MDLSTKAVILGYKRVAEIIRSGRTIPYELEASIRDQDKEKAMTIADPQKIDHAYESVLDGMEHAIETIEKRNWYYWAKPKRAKSSPEYGAERGFKEFYKGESLTTEEKQVTLAALAIRIEEELNILKKERDTIRI